MSIKFQISSFNCRYRFLILKVTIVSPHGPRYTYDWKYWKFVCLGRRKWAEVSDAG